jgi:hypothetical protein
MALAEEAHDMGKRMDRKLREYKRDWAKGEHEPNLTVACLLWGEWCAPHGETYVRRLKAAVGRNLSVPHRFVCLTDRHIAGIDCLPLPTVEWKRNLTKMWLFAPDNGLRGRVLAFDLDDIPIGLLDEMAQSHARFICAEDPWDKGKAGGGVCAFTAGDLMLENRLYRPCVEAMDEVESISGGSERHWLRHALPEAEFWPGGLVVDAKPFDLLDIVESVPNDASVAHFHGHPRPHEVERDWLKEHWR